jgi:predicted RNA-binding Zn-ribbon protein involved in translation (DUF1610 family)|tara:strand:- start:948 stop:1121 length:174 start_codon:yes stop_codon:yes gene_type:complete
MAKEQHCSSCKVKISSSLGAVNFECPECGKEKIIRCKKCRVKVIPYVCSNCNFEGPN